MGYDQIYYKLGRWQGDWNRQTWQADPTNQLSYLNKTIGKNSVITVKQLVPKAAMILAAWSNSKQQI